MKELAPYVKDYFIKRMIEYEKARYVISIKILGLILLIIVVTSAILTYLNVLKGESFTFLMGIIVGYIMTHLKMFIKIEEKK
ncbi:MAG: hypothetical protein DRZ80_03775 [Thermoprotei archaeon]|nr:hypothetical protein [Candidatus Baldrarchaeota archaeon]RLE74897.1 MAG: hypothetical protein DRZ80_03775 [Thermoprotei archaeon]